jgi:hypothetical protein
VPLPRKFGVFIIRLKPFPDSNLKFKGLSEAGPLLGEFQPLRSISRTRRAHGLAAAFQRLLPILSYTFVWHEPARPQASGSGAARHNQAISILNGELRRAMRVA